MNNTSEKMTQLSLLLSVRSEYVLCPTEHFLSQASMDKSMNKIESLIIREVGGREALIKLWDAETQLLAAIEGLERVSSRIAIKYK